jgi:L-fucose dehydrogenase
MNLNLTNKIIIVSGGAKGIGKGIADVLSAEGAVVVIIGKDAEDNAIALKNINGRGKIAFAHTADLSDPAACQAAITEVVRRFKGIDGLVNNAGVNDGISLENGSYDEFMKSLHNNLVHYYLLAHYALPYLKQSKGHIVNIGSKTAETGQGGTSAYAAANGGRNALTREWAVELLKYGIRVNAVIVAECYTPLYERWISKFEDPQAKLTEIHDSIPFGRRMTTTEEIANMVAFLLSDKSSHTTGQLIHVDGGYVHLDRAIGRSTIEQ